MLRLSLLLTLLFSLLSAALPASAEQPRPASATVGVYVTRIDNIDMANGSFDAIFWLWYQTTDPGFSLEQDIELPSARSVEYSHTYG